MMVDEWGVTYCKKCGHESHCGNPLRKMIDRSRPHAAGLKEIEVCKNCRCDRCLAPDWG